MDNNKDLIKKVKEHFQLSENEKICLYAPTFRVSNSLNVYNIKYETLINGLKSKFNGNWKLLIRLHPNISNSAKDLSVYNCNIINATDYPDIQELLVASDFLITDYSSCIFDYAISKKPAMIYASDINEYKNDRDFEIKLEDTPFPIATNNFELMNAIEKYNIKKYQKLLTKFYDNI